MAGELILVVEDNQMNAKLLRDVLGSRGYEVAESTTAEEGLEMFGVILFIHTLLRYMRGPGSGAVEAAVEVR